MVAVIFCGFAIWTAHETYHYSGNSPISVKFIAAVFTTTIISEILHPIFSTTLKYRIVDGHRFSEFLADIEAYGTEKAVDRFLFRLDREVHSLDIAALAEVRGMKR